jgi:hypothetical protein
LSVIADIQEGDRVGRFVLIRDADGRWHALSMQAVYAISDLDDGCALALPGGKLLRLMHPMGTVLAWLTGPP